MGGWSVELYSCESTIRDCGGDYATYTGTRAAHGEDLLGTPFSAVLAR